MLIGHVLVVMMVHEARPLTRRRSLLLLAIYLISRGISSCFLGRKRRRRLAALANFRMVRCSDVLFVGRRHFQVLCVSMTKPNRLIPLSTSRRKESERLVERNEDRQSKTADSLLRGGKG